MKKFILDNLPRIKEFSLATADQDDNPWVVAINLCFDKELGIIWHSRKDTEHSKHIKQNPNVAICAYDDFADIGDFGFYAKAQAHEVTDKDELKRLLKLRFDAKNKPTPSVEEYSGESPNRIYYAALTDAWLNDQSKRKQVVDLSIFKG